MMSSRTSLRIALSTLLLIALLSAAFAQQPLFRFVQLSDTQPSSEEHWANTAKAVQITDGLQPAFVLYGGDLTDNGAPTDVERLAAICTKLQVRLYPVPGNHDIPMVTSHHYQKYFGPEHWSMRYGNFKFVGLNTCAPYFMDGSDPDFVQWVDQELGDPTTPNRFVIGHYNLWDYNPENVGGAAWLQELLDKHQVIAYLHGHDHTFRHGYPRGSDTLNVSSWSARDKGFLSVDVYPLEAKLLKCDLQGEVEELRTIHLAAEAKLPGPTPMKPWPGAAEMEAILAP